MDFNSLWDAFASLWPLNMNEQQAPLILQPTINPTPIPGSGTATAVIELPGDCNIQIDDWVYWSSDAGFPDESGFRVTIYYGNDWAINYPSVNGVRGENLFGTAQRPGRVGYRPWKINTYGNRGLLQFNLTNLATTTTTVEITLRGNRRKA